MYCWQYKAQPSLWSDTGSNIAAVGGPLYDRLRPRYSNRWNSKGVAVLWTHNIHHINDGYIHSRGCDQDGSDMLSLAGFYSRVMTYLGGMRVLVLVRGLSRADQSRWLCCDNGFRFQSSSISPCNSKLSMWSNNQPCYHHSSIVNNYSRSHL